MHLPLLQDMLIILAFSVGIVFLLQRLKLPSILGFLLTGVLIGPYGLSLIDATEQVELISEIGVIMLLFVIGMELSLDQLKKIKRTVFVGGFLQVFLTVVVVGLLAFYMNFPWNESLFIGFLFSLSSTAIVLKILQDRNELTSPHGRNALAILIFQDIIVVPMMLTVPIIAGATDDVVSSVLSLLIKTLIVILITYVSARYLIPRFLHLVAKTKSKELFLLTTIAICFAVAFLTSEAGLSLALGAFLAGLIISESDYSHQATSIILPFKELFTSFFFVSIGMLLDLKFFGGHLTIILLAVGAVFLIKSMVLFIAIGILRYPTRTVLLTGLSLFQVGEFAFILSKVGIQYGLISDEMNQYFLSISIISMFLTPFVILFSERIANKVMESRVLKTIRKHSPVRANMSLNDLDIDELEDHLVIIGFGINGSNLAKAAKYAKIPYAAVELNADTVKSQRLKGEPILYGDAAHEHILEALHVEKARAVVIAISDSNATKAIIAKVRAISKNVYIVVRTRYVAEISELISLGADEVIPEEFETSIQIFARVMNSFMIGDEEIEEFTEIVRADNYNLFQGKRIRPRSMLHNPLSHLKIRCFKLNSEGCRLEGKEFKEIDFLNKYGVRIIGVMRNEKVLDPEDPITFAKNDLLFVNGRPDDIDKFEHLVRG